MSCDYPNFNKTFSNYSHKFEDGQHKHNQEDISTKVNSANSLSLEIVKEYTCGVTIDWSLVQNADVYKVEKYIKKSSEWVKVAWVSKGPVKIVDLDENFAYPFRAQALKYQNDIRKYVQIACSKDLVALTKPAPPTTLCLHRAIRKGQTFLIKRLLQRRPSLIEYPAPNGYLPLANAIIYGEMSIIDHLLKAGASVHNGNPWNRRTPLQLAFYYGRLPVARMLLNRNADLEAHDAIGMSACHFAVDANRLEILNFALEHGANVETTDGCRWTLLLRAESDLKQVELILVVMHSDLDMLQLLVLHGANLRARDWLGQNCVNLARLYGNTKAEKYLGNLLKKQSGKLK